MSIKELLLRRTARLLLHLLIRVNNLIEHPLHIALAILYCSSDVCNVNVTNVIPALVIPTGGSKVNIVRKCYDFNCLVIQPLESTPAVVGTVGDSI